MRNPIKMRQERARIIAQAEKIVEAAEALGRDLTEEESRKVNGLMDEADNREREIEQVEAENQALMAAHDAAMGLSGAPATRFFDRQTGKEIRTFGSGDSITAYARSRSPIPGDRDLSAGRALRGILTGDWKNADAERRLLGTTGEGAVLIPAPLAAEWFDLARPQSACMLGGARIVELESKTLSLAAIDADPTPEWKEENEAATGTDVLLREIKLTSKTLYVGPITCSRELVYDAPNVEAILNSTMSGAMAMSLDRAGLLGDDDGIGPSGLVNDSGIRTVESVGDITSYLPFSMAFAELQEENAGMAFVSAVYNPSVSLTLDTLTDTTDQPLQPPPSFASLKGKYVTTQIPNTLGDGENETLAILGDFRQMLIGARLQLFIEASEHAGEAWERFQVKFRAVIRADIALARPGHFCALTGITGYTS